MLLFSGNKCECDCGMMSFNNCDFLMRIQREFPSRGNVYRSLISIFARCLNINKKFFFIQAESLKK